MSTFPKLVDENNKPLTFKKWLRFEIALAEDLSKNLRKAKSPFAVALIARAFALEQALEVFLKEK